MEGQQNNLLMILFTTVFFTKNFLHRTDASLQKYVENSYF